MIHIIVLFAKPIVLTMIRTREDKCQAAFASIIPHKTILHEALNAIGLQINDIWIGDSTLQLTAMAILVQITGTNLKLICIREECPSVHNIHLFCLGHILETIAILVVGSEVFVVVNQ